MKFTKEGNVAIMRSLSGENIIIKIIDTGIGISDEVQKCRVPPFAQADASIMQLYGGSGLGLAISRQLSEILGGSLTLESKRNAGSAFALCLPIHAQLNESRNSV